MPTGVYGTHIAVDADMKKAIMDRVDVDPISGCWNWKLSLDKDGYGHLGRGSSRKGTATNPQSHRVSYEAFIGPIQEDKELDHLCRNRKCANPNHLEQVTDRENCLRGEGPSAKNYRKTHCNSGHELTPENTYRYKNESGYMRRMCRTCVFERQAKRRAKLKAVEK